MLKPQIEVIVTRPGEHLIRHLLAPGEYLIGRSADCQIVVDSPDVSQHHARLVIAPDSVSFDDLGSSNGSFIEGERVTGLVQLCLPQKVRVASAVLEIKAVPAVLGAPGDVPSVPCRSRREEALTEDSKTQNPKSEIDQSLLTSAPTILPRKYQVGARIAQGGMGAILNAQDLKLQRAVAMKVMLAGAKASPHSLRRFTQEARVLSRLEHPNIVPIHDLDVDELGQTFYTMKLVHGVTLEQVLRDIHEGKPETIRRYPLNQLLTIFQKVCDAVGFAHAQGIIHRDLKPENIMLGEFGEVLVMDWGLAKILKEDPSDPSESGSAPTLTRESRPDPERGRPRPQHAAESIEPDGPEREGKTPTPKLGEAGAVLTLEGQIMGTPHYMAPEQAAGRLRDMDARTDIYALGGILYAILTLRAPILGTDLKVILERIQAGDIRPPSSYHPTPGKPAPSPEVPASASTAAFPHCPSGRIPPSLSAVAMKALAVRPGERYQTLQDLQKDITAYQSGFATSAELPSGYTLVKLWIRRHSTESIALAVITLMVAGFVVYALVSKQKADIILAALQATAPHFAAKTRDLIARQNFGEALQAINHAISISPSEPEYHVIKGNILQSLLRFEEAKGAYEAALRYQTNHTVATESLSLCAELLKYDSLDARWSVPNLARIREHMLHQERFEEARGMLQRQLARDQELRTTHLKKWREHLDKVGVKGELSVDEKGLLVLDLQYSSIENLTVLKGIPLNGLRLDFSKVTDLSPLKGMPLKTLTLTNTRVTDIGPLKDFPLENLDVSATGVTDLSPLKGMPLKQFRVGVVTDLRPLRGMKLEELSATGVRLADLSPLRGMLIKTLSLAGSAASDLRPLEGMPLEFLYLSRTLVSDLNPLKGMPINYLMIDYTKVTDFAVLRELPSLSHLRLDGLRIHDLSVLKGLKLTALEIAETEVNDLIALKGMPLEYLVLNHTLVSNLQPLVGMPIWMLGLEFTKVTNLEPLRFFPLRDLGLGGTPVTDLSALRGLNLTQLNLHNTKVSDLRALKGMPLEGWVNFSKTEITDLRPLEGMRIRDLLLSGTKVSDLSPLRGMPLKSLDLRDCLQLEDLTPLQDCQELERVAIPLQCRNLEVLRKLPKLKVINRGGQEYLVDDFWKAYDARKGAVP